MTDDPPVLIRYTTHPENTQLCRNFSWACKAGTQGNETTPKKHVW